MKDKINAKGILSAFIIILVLCLGTNIYGASVKEEQEVDVKKVFCTMPPKEILRPREQLKLDIVFVLDNSGSMITNDPKFITRKVVTNFLNNVGEGFRIGMVIYDQEASLLSRSWE